CSTWNPPRSGLPEHPDRALPAPGNRNRRFEAEARRSELPGGPPGGRRPEEPRAPGLEKGRPPDGAGVEFHTAGRGVFETFRRKILPARLADRDRKSTRLNSSHDQ